MALFTKGIGLWFKESSDPNLNIKFAKPAATNEKWGDLIPGLQEVGELSAGSASSAGYDKIEVTTLADSKHEYIDGLIADAGEASSIDFTFLYDKDIYATFLEIAGDESVYDPANESGHKGSLYYVTIPHTSGALTANESTNSSFEIYGLTSVKVNSAAVNSALTMTVTITPVKEIKFTA